MQSVLRALRSQPTTRLVFVHVVPDPLFFEGNQLDRLGQIHSAYLEAKGALVGRGRPFTQEQWVHVNHRQKNLRKTSRCNSMFPPEKALVTQRTRGDRMMGHQLFCCLRAFG